MFLGPVLQNKIIVLNAAKAPTNDLQVRQAIIQAINKKAIIDKELAGLAEPVGTTFPTNAPYSNIESRWNYDLDKALALSKCPSSAKDDHMYTQLTCSADNKKVTIAEDCTDRSCGASCRKVQKDLATPACYRVPHGPGFELIHVGCASGVATVNVVDQLPGMTCSNLNIDEAKIEER